MIKKILYFLLSVTPCVSFAQSGSKDATAFHSLVTDSSTVIKPAGWGTLYYNGQSKKWRATQNGQTFDLLPHYGTAQQIPFMNNGANGFQYSGKLQWDDNNESFIAAPRLTFLGGSFPNAMFHQNFVSGEEHTFKMIGGGITDTFVTGWKQSVGDGIHSFSGSACLVFGEGNFAFGIESFVGGNNALAAWNNGSTDASGSFVYSFTPPPPSGNPDSVTVAPPLRANNNGSLNIGRNTSAQMNGRGALGKGSMILGGVNNHIPTNSSDNVILGGNGLSARAGENFQTYVENLNINSIPINSDTLTQVLVRDPLNGQVKYRNASSFSSIPISLGSPPSSSNDIGMVGEVRWTTNYIYVCVAANTWVRAALSSW